MDRFDDIWKNRFNEEELSSGDWNASDDDVWTDIAADLFPKKEKRRWLGWLWRSIGLGVVLLLVGLVIYFGKKENSTSSISKQDKLGTLITEKENLNKIGEEQAKELSETSNKLINVSPTAKEDKSTKEKNNTITKKSNQVVEPKNRENSVLTNFSVHPKSELGPNISLSNVSKLVMDPKGGIKNLREEISFGSIPFAKFLLEFQQSTPPVSIFSSSIIEEKNPPKFGAVSLGFETGFIFWKHRISDQYTSDLSPFDFNYKNNWGWQSSLNLNIDLGKYFDAYLGFQYEQIQTTSGHNSNLTYSLSEEESPSDPLNQYALSLATPYGLSGATFNFNRNQTLGANEVDLLVDFHSAHLIKNISAPIGMMVYPLGKEKKLVPSATVGFGINYLANISNSIQNIETNHAAIQFEDSASSSFVAPTLEKWHFDYRIGVGLNYKISPSLRLNFQYDWSRGINPIYKLDNYKTTIDRHHLSLGLTKAITLKK